MLDLDVAGRRCAVEPGIVLDDLNRALKPHGLWFPVDISTASRATIGGMAANNSCGARSLRYGTMRDNVLAIDAVLADGISAHFGPIASDLSDVPTALRDLAKNLLALGAREAAEIEARFPKVQRRVGGYNLDALLANAPNLSHLLVGSEGTLAFSTRIELKLWPLLGRRAVGACHFGGFRQAMEAARHIVELGPIAVELVDRTMIELARDIAMFRPTLQQFVRGEPDAILLVEFGENDFAENQRRLARLHALMGDLGFGWDKAGARYGGVVDVLEGALQTAIADLRTAGLNVMMSMKEAGKPVSFVEDCAVPLEHLAEYTARLTELFERHGTRGTWYAHASVGCLHVRPVLNLRLDQDVKAMRAIAEEAFALVRAYKGSHSGEHGDGIVRSEFHEQMFGSRLVRAFEAVKDRFDPTGLFNPGKIVRAPNFDDRNLFRYAPGYRGTEFSTALDWSAYPGASGGLLGAVEMCNNNGACRKSLGGAMCPSFRVTREERDVTRGRANTLRLALTGQLGPDALTSDNMAETLKLCVSCKACRRECPTGVDMARMKIEVLAARAEKRGISLHDRLVGFLPRYAQTAARLPWLFNLRDAVPGGAALSETLAGFSARRRLPRWRSDYFRDAEAPAARGEGAEVVLFADTFNRYFERENIDAALVVLRPHVAFGRQGPGGAARGGAGRRRARPVDRPRRSHRGSRAELHLRVPRRDSRPAQDRRRPAACRASIHLRGISGRGSGCGKTSLAARAYGAPRAPARPLSPEIVRRHAGGGTRAQTRAGSRGRDRGIELLWHGGRVRLWPRHDRRLARHGRAEPAARGAQRRRRHAHRRRRYLLPPADPRRHRAGAAACGPGARGQPGAELGCELINEHR